MEKEGKPANYRYPIIGYLITDTPIEGIEGENEVVLDGTVRGIAAALEAMPKLENAGPPWSEASDVLLRFGEDFFKTHPKPRAKKRST